MKLNKNSLNQGDNYLVLSALDNKYCKHIFSTIKDINEKSIIFHSLSGDCSDIAMRLENNRCLFYTSMSESDNQNAELKGLIDMDYNSEYYIVKIDYEDYSKVNIIKPFFNSPMDLNQNIQKIILDDESIDTFTINAEQNISKIKSIISELIDNYHINISELSYTELNSFNNMYSVKCNYKNNNIQDISGFKIYSDKNMSIISCW